ncbi:MAG: hypothetical protein LLF81_00225 [Porphyromonadaceae bacterium]|nr:hypothetical protein [Porphyromonadaceae bacterium]
MMGFTILRRVYLNGLPVNCRGFRLPEKQVIRNGAMKKLRNEVECFFVAEWRGASRCEWSEGGGRREHEVTSASDAYWLQPGWRIFLFMASGLGKCLMQRGREWNSEGNGRGFGWCGLLRSAEQTWQQSA